MKHLILFLILITSAFAQKPSAAALAEQQGLRKDLETVYRTWRAAMIQKDANVWKNITATHRRSLVTNRLNSERRPFPQAVFEVPAAPPALTGLRAVQVEQKALTAKCIYFGKIDFAVGGDPTDNLIIIDFVLENSGWKYDVSEFVSLAALPDVRAELTKGDYSYISKTPAFRPTGRIPAVKPIVPIAPYIGKIYVFCPGRAVDLTVNGISPHSFGNAKEAETILGGLRDGINTISYNTKELPGAKGDEALSIRVYALSQVKDVLPEKIYEYQIPEGKKLTASATTTFTLDAAVAKKISGK